MTTKKGTKSTSSHLFVVPFAEIYWRTGDNERTTLGETKDLRESLSQRGWVDQNPISVMEIECDSDLTDDEKRLKVKSAFAQCMEERKARWDALKNANTPDDVVKRSVFESLFVRNNKLVEPKYQGNAGFRRASCFEAAMLDRFRDTQVSENDKLRELIPVILRTYVDDAERIIDQQLENAIQSVGTVAVPDMDKLRITKKLFDMGKRQIEIRRLYTDTTGQKLFGICQIDNYWRNLKIFERLLKGDNDPDHIPFGPIRHADLGKMNNRKEVDDKRKAGKTLSEKERVLEPLPESEVARYFADLRKGSEGNAAKIMKKGEIESLSKNHAVHWFRVAGTAVFDNSISGMIPYIEHSDALNLHKELIDGGFAERAFTGLRIAKNNPDVLDLFKDVLDKLTPNELLTVLSGALAAKTQKKS